MGILFYVWIIYIRMLMFNGLNNVIVNILWVRVVVFLILNERVLYFMLLILNEFNFVVKMVENWYWMRGLFEKW